MNKVGRAVGSDFWSKTILGSSWRNDEGLPSGCDGLENQHHCIKGCLALYTM